QGYYISHEGFVGLLGGKLEEEDYKKVEEKKTFKFPATSGWLGLTDKYWAAALIPDPEMKFEGNFEFRLVGSLKPYQSLYFLSPLTVQPTATASTTTRLFAGAKEVSIVDGYKDELKIDRFDKVIDWGMFYFLTKPLFLTMDWIYHRVGNFGL